MEQNSTKNMKLYHLKYNFETSTRADRRQTCACDDTQTSFKPSSPVDKFGPEMVIRLR